MPSEQVLKTITDQFAKFDKIKDKNLFIRPEWGEINFEKGKGVIEKSVSLIKTIQNLPYEALPESPASTFGSQLSQFIQGIEAIDQFKIANNSNPTSNRDSLISNLNSYYEQFTVNCGMWIPYLAYQRGDIQKNIERLNETIQDAEALFNDEKEKIKSHKSEVDEIVSATKMAAASAGVAVFTENFKNKSNEFNAIANRWLWASTVISIGTIIAALLFLWLSPVPTSTYEMIHLSISKIVIIALLISMAFWSGRNYKALKHQAALNDHRHLALLTFQAFVKATNDNSIKDAVLAEAARSIFIPVNPGYITDADAEFGKAAESIGSIIKG